VSEPLTTIAQTEADIVTEAATLLQQGAHGREMAALLLYRKLGQRILRSLKWQGVPEADAEELLADIVLKFVSSAVTVQHSLSSIAFLWLIAKNVQLDWFRKQHALMRGGSFSEVTLDEDEWEAVFQQGPFEISQPPWVVSAVHRACAMFQRERPHLAEVLLLYAQGFSCREIACIVNGIIDPAKVTLKQEQAAKSRVHHAVKVAQDYFQECKE
jgi:DNA-directed RNA polymerase specialized sigma24 family protein